MAHSKNEDYVFSYLVKQGLPRAAACGILANMYHESGVIPERVQDDYSSGYAVSRSYTQRVDSGMISSTDFIHHGPNGGGYGLCQWTYSSRKQALWEYKSSKNTSIGNLDMQLEFLLRELKGVTPYKEYNIFNRLKSIPDTAEGAFSAGQMFCTVFERPEGDTSYKRGIFARDNYKDYYTGSNSGASLTPKMGEAIVTVALAQVGKRYVYNTNGPDTFDCSGLVYYCFNRAGYKLDDMSAQGYYDYFVKKGAQPVSLESTGTADLLFWKNSKEIYHISIADGKGGDIQAKGEAYGVVHNETIGSPTYALRVLSNTEVSFGDIESSIGGPGGSPIGGSPGISSLEYATLTSIDPYASIIESNLSSVAAVGYDYGYLIDMDHGGVFKFYIPEFSERAGASWEPINIRGRSVTVQAYQNTNSRVISVSLDLYAGVGMYEARSEGEEAGLEAVSRLHEDMNFLKSLEYPDYTQAIIKPPPVVHLILGASVNIAGVVSDVSIEHLKPLDKYNRSMYVKASFTVTQIATNPPDWKDIREGSSTIRASEDVSSMSNRKNDIIIPNVS